MKIKNFTIYFFAIIGFVVIACSAAATADDDSPDDIAPIAQSNIGKYQMVSWDTGNSFAVLNTSTGEIQTYIWFNRVKWEKSRPSITTSVIKNIK